mmetsp:Transcript_67943/g.155916  ORF Transcript_67943/g.155916 Transcript_67943/m.155916 type:complete len:163 (+) Transcript_67943:59-547(+)
MGRTGLEKFLRRFTGNKNPTVVDRAWRALDTDNDGTVALHEFLSWWVCDEFGSQFFEIKRAFDSYDLNGDGYIDAEEFRRLVDDHSASAGSFRCDNHMRAALEELDLDGDNRVSLREFVWAWNRTHSEGVSPATSFSMSSPSVSAQDLCEDWPLVGSPRSHD